MTDPDADPDSDVGLGSDADPDLDLDSDPDPGADPDSDADLDPHAEPGPSADADLDAEPGPGADPDLDLDSDPDSDAGLDSGADPDPGAAARHLPATRAEGDGGNAVHDPGDDVLTGRGGMADRSRRGELTVNRVLDRCGTLGPGLRAVIWVQGCPLRCRGCVAPETLPFAGGEVRGVAEVAAWLTGLTDVEGVTLSGGEPFSQAQSLADLLDAVRERRPGFTAMAYTGFRHEALLRGAPGQRALLDRLDLLVDGPYVAARHGDLLWRGSSNQRVVVLTERYHHVTSLTDAGAGIEVSVGDDGQFSWAGVPAVPGFRAFVEEQLTAAGYVVGAQEAAVATQGEIRGTDERITEVQHRRGQCGPTAGGSAAPGPAGGRAPTP